MVSHLASTYGQFVATHADTDYYSFPTAEALAERVTEEDLREAGFGYRAKYIAATAKQLCKLAKAQNVTCEEMLLSWRLLPRQQVADKLVPLAGIGKKVAGCIALMSLDQLGEIPVDTHVWKIAQRYMPELSSKNLTSKVYDSIGDFFRKRFGEHTAGLAHTILFAGELKGFKGLAPGGGVIEAAWMKEQDSLVKREVVLDANEGIAGITPIKEEKDVDLNPLKEENTVANEHSQDNSDMKDESILVEEQMEVDKKEPKLEDELVVKQLDVDGKKKKKVSKPKRIGNLSQAFKKSKGRSTSAKRKPVAVVPKQESESNPTD